MHGIEVGIVVDSILNAFGNASDVFNRLKLEIKSKKVRKADANADDAQRHEELASGPVKIRSQFDRSAARHGKNFVVGDAFTQTKLAQTLLALNNGLLEVINFRLSKKPKSKVLPTRSLLNLSRQATYETLDALQNLDGRLSSRNLLASQDVTHERDKKPKRQAKAEKRDFSQNSEKSSSPEQNPLLTRGGWVKTSSGDFIVVSAEGARKRAARKSEKKRKYPDSRTSTQKDVSDKTNISPPVASNQHIEHCSCQTLPGAQRSQFKPAFDVSHGKSSELQRPPSLYLVPADVLNHSSVNQDTPPRPPKIPLHTRPNPNPKPRPASGITFMTVSTKIGEIPPHKVPDHPISREELENRPLPYDIPPPLLQGNLKSRRRFWRFKLKG